MSAYEVTPIGTIKSSESKTFLKLAPEFIPALQALEEFRSELKTEQPYKKSPEFMGIFATRSPVRPNPIALSTAEIIGIDYQNGIVQIAYIDANDNTPLLDIKPYTPSLDRVETPGVPAWCSHWPQSLEESASFAWENEFNF